MPFFQYNIYLLYVLHKAKKKEIEKKKKIKKLLFAPIIVLLNCIILYRNWRDKLSELNILPKNQFGHKYTSYEYGLLRNTVLLAREGWKHLYFVEPYLHLFVPKLNYGIFHQLFVPVSEHQIVYGFQDQRKQGGAVNFSMLWCSFVKQFIFISGLNDVFHGTRGKITILL